MVIPGLVNVDKKSWKDPPFFMGKLTISMGKLTISTGPFSMSLFVCLPGRVDRDIFYGGVRFSRKTDDLLDPFGLEHDDLGLGIAP